jgi:hypothetical protein
MALWKLIPFSWEEIKQTTSLFLTVMAAILQVIKATGRSENCQYSPLCRSDANGLCHSEWLEPVASFCSSSAAYDPDSGYLNPTRLAVQYTDLAALSKGHIMHVQLALCPDLSI